MEDPVEDLTLGQDTSPMVASVDKRKPKLGELPADLWDNVEDDKGVPSLWDVANVMRSDRVFQSTNLQAGSSSNPLVQRPNVPVAQRNAPLAILIVPSGAPKTDIIQKQLEWIPTVISIWGLICSS